MLNRVPQSPLAPARLLTGLVLLVSALGLSTFSVPAQTGQTSLETRLADGTKLLDGGRYLEAIGAFNNAKQIAPQDGRAYFYCGMAYAQAGRMRAAASELGEAVHLAPDQLAYRVFQAHVLEQLKQPAGAEQALAVFQNDQMMARLDPAWLRLLADVYYRLQLTDRALSVLDVWAKRDPADARIDLYRGEVYVVKGQPDMALTCYKRSIEKSPENAEAYFEMGTILYEKNQLVPAKDAFANAVRRDPHNPEYRAKLGSVYLAMGDTDEAIAALESVESAAPILPMIYYTLGRAYRTKGNSTRAAQYMEKFQKATSAERDRKEVESEVERPIAQAQRELDAGNAGAARKLFEEALRIDPNRWEPNAYLAEMNLNSGDFPHAYPYLQKLEQLDSDSAIGNFLMARYWYQQQDYKQSEHYAEKVKLSRPDNSEVHALLGEIYGRFGEKEKARQEFEEALRLFPDRADLRERLRQVAGKEPGSPQP